MTSATIATAVKDLVCGMNVDSPTTAARTEHKGQTYYFCGPSCKKKFDLDPAQYMENAAGASKSEHGCCG